MAVSQAKQIEFIKQIGPIAQKICAERNLPNVSLWTCIVQACHESGYGTAALMKNANAYFGIKATDAWVKAAKYGGRVYRSKTKECYDGKTMTVITDGFRAYYSMEDSISDYFDLITGSSRYKGSVTKPDVRSCLTHIIVKVYAADGKTVLTGGYATGPDYVNHAMGVYNAHKQLIEMYRTDGNNISDHIQQRRILKKGAEGSDVIIMQKKLIAAGYSCGKTGADGKFGPATFSALKKFQADKGIVVDGICGPVTWSKLDTILI